MSESLKVVLVTGSRDWQDTGCVWDAIDAELPDLIIHGACPTGADSIAADYSADIETDAFGIAMPAQWDAHTPPGKAGPIRNSEMVQLLKLLRTSGHRCVVLAFPIGESPGTRGCMRMARVAGFAVDSHGRDTA